MTGADFLELLAEERLCPRGEWRADLRMGILASTIANCHRGKNQKPWKAKDFIPDFMAAFVPKARQTAKQIRAVLEAMTVKMGGTLPGKK